MNADVIIAGAGVAGLACAANLADSGLRVHVFERGSQPGGRAASWRDERTGDMDRIVEQTRAEVCEALPAAATASLRHWRVRRIPMAIACP